MSAIYIPNFKGGVALQDCSEDLTGRVKIAGEYNNRECGLEITNLTQADSGVWECEVGQEIFIDLNIYLCPDGGVPAWRLEFREKTPSRDDFECEAATVN